MIFEKNKLYEVYTDYNEDSFFVSYIIFSSEELIIIEKIDRNGEYDGISVLRTDSIMKINSCTGYLKKYKDSKYVDKSDILTFTKDNTFHNIWEKIKKSNLLISLYTLDETNTFATVEKTSLENDCVILELSVYSEDQSDFDGFCQINVENIHEFSFDTKYLRFISNQLLR